MTSLESLNDIGIQWDLVREICCGTDWLFAETGCGGIILNLESVCPGRRLSRFHGKALQHAHIPLIIARLVQRRFGDEGAMSKARIVEQSAERLNTNIALPNVLVPVKFRPARSLRIVAMPHPHRLKSDR